MKKANLRLYFIMGSTNTLENPADVLKRAIEGGISAFQFREKGVGAKGGVEKYKLGAELRDICSEYKIPFIVNDDVKLAIQLHADGIHIGQQDESIVTVRKRIPAYMTVGVSVSTVKEAYLAEQQGADYLGVGPVYSTSTKEDALEPVGIDRIKEVCRAVNLPVVAIGGIDRMNTSEIMRSGAAGISVISAISRANNCEEAARKLAEEVERGGKF
ncbi:thiamine phosphate synthase [Virgibacillus flavescens]|uniref:thiamine phosphate synthase n=1 Tax=Virgibacillus flavescens TaxID=1611422 RepID=UPI003D3384B5